jgi:hypothetical protein
LAIEMEYYAYKGGLEGRQDGCWGVTVMNGMVDRYIWCFCFAFHTIYHNGGCAEIAFSIEKFTKR